MAGREREPAEQPPGLAVGLLGELEVRLDRRLLPMGHAQQRSVLAALAARCQWTA
ncbi:hypothetical protein ILP97_43350 [Amycolatopsis sp. H6(2020)]|nr:hypothetical protein [Amycolatopsis sp. H6(2020)]